MKTKICRVCQQRKKITSFHIKTSNQDGRNTECKNCKNTYSKNLHQKNKSAINSKKKQYYKNNKENIKTRQQNYYINNKEKILLKQKKYQKKNKLKINKYHRNRRIKDEKYRILHSLRVRLNQTTKGRLSDSTKKLIGCSLEELKIHLENQFTKGMNWKNYGRNGWHIDHIKPCTSFDLTDPVQQKQCFHYSNLQPLWAKDNISKGNKILSI